MQLHEIMGMIFTQQFEAEAEGGTSREVFTDTAAPEEGMNCQFLKSFFPNLFLSLKRRKSVLDCVIFLNDGHHLLTTLGCSIR